MPAFSWTAPQITPDQEKAELQALSDNERQLLEDEKFGREQPLVETETMVTEGPALLRAAIRDIPEPEKRAYLEAATRAPDLVERESNPLAFLRCEKYNYWAAARHLVAYWHIRLIAFGPEKAFLPMTTRGAMADDEGILQEGILRILPNDEHGRRVIFFDRARAIPPRAPRDAMVRLLFYVHHLTSLEKSAQLNGVVVIVDARLKSHSHFDRILVKRFGQISSSVPMKLKAFHALVGQTSKAIVLMCFPILKHIVGMIFRLHVIEHIGTDKEVLRDMDPYGLPIAEIRDALISRSSSMEKYHEWLADLRAAEETVLHS